MSKQVLLSRCDLQPGDKVQFSAPIIIVGGRSLYRGKAGDVIAQYIAKGKLKFTDPDPYFADYEKILPLSKFRDDQYAVNLSG